MNTQEMIPVFTGSIHNESTQLVDARTLHRFLEVDAHFKDWIARRIAEYDFQEGEDFCSFLSKSGGGRPRREYSITLDMGKELAMVERNEKGRQARRYFIECEKRLQQIAPHEAATIRGQTIGTDGFHCLAAVVDGKVRHLPSAIRRGAKNHIWSQVHKAFSVVTAEDIPADQLDSARNFIAAYALEGEWLPKDRVASAVDTCSWSNIAFLVDCVEKCWKIVESRRLATHLSGLGCNAGVELAGFLWDGLGSAAHVRKHCANELNWQKGASA
ncbi:antA/AntB antirepressor family protein [Pseudomonas aeruginosa]|uniref:antA/AntB antirepressor family protein n=1 Tax=Pseudomonas aeruginosa TaxID=287 RepID=UPI000E05FE0C|nr:antA/AntB antirepressor family protein [Pseudomonas aeruginosa]RCM54452.1 Phage anti-repressor protein [Pseudomonas aeruginosa]